MTEELMTVDFGEHEGAGFENVDGQHMKIPFLILLQALSPQVKEEHDLYVPGAKPGMLMNSVTKELYPDGVELVPALLDHCYVEWVPRNRGGGFVARHELKSDVVREAQANAKSPIKLKVRREEKVDGDSVTVINDLVETFYISGILVLDDGERLEPIIVGFNSSKIAPYREWITRINMFTIPAPGGRKQKPPLYSHRVLISTRMQVRSQGEFFNYVLEPAVENNVKKSLITDTESPLFLKGGETRKLLASGAAQADYESQGVASAVEETDDF